MGYEPNGEEDCRARCSTKCRKSRLNYSKSGYHLQALSCRVLPSETVAIREGGALLKGGEHPFENHASSKESMVF